MVSLDSKRLDRQWASYTMRNRFHALCPYFAMFPESFAETWIDRLSRRGDVVLDPFSGRGTTAFQSQLMGRRAVACDTNDVAYCVTKAKTQPPTFASLGRRLAILSRDFDRGLWARRASAMPEFFQVAYHRKTLAQLLYLRASLRWQKRKTDCMIAALALGSLHGESKKSPSYLSNQMPRTISTKPAYSVRFWRKHGYTAPERDAFVVLGNMAEYRYETAPPVGESWVFQTDMRRLPWLSVLLPDPIRLVVTSPPYLDITNFEEDQWLRLWFLGGPPYPTRGRVSPDDRHSRAEEYWRFIADMWRSLGAVVAKNAHVVIRIGARGIEPKDLVKMLFATARFAQRSVGLASQSISQLKGRQTDAFRPGSEGCLVEIDCHFQFTG